MLRRRFFYLAMLALSSSTSFATLGHAGAPVNQPLTRSSAKQLFMVTLIPPQEAILVNQMHSWQVRLTSIDGKPINQASFIIQGGMPQHNHGLPTKPQVTQNLGHGTYLLEGVKFSMAGAWELNVQIQTEKEQDKAHFVIQIELPPTEKAANSALPSAANGINATKDAK